MMRGAWLQHAAQRLEHAGIANAPLEARILFSLAPEIDPALFPANFTAQADVTALQEETLDGWLSRREKGETVWRILGKRGFWKADFLLNEATLEPRPDSETLIEAALEFYKGKPAPRHMLDIGTGTGCLLLSLLQEFPEAQGVATDKSARALEAASANAKALTLQTRAQFVETDWTTGIAGKFDLIVSNPPYIATGVIAGLQPEVRDYDPALALDGGADGLNAYRAIIPQAAALLNPDGVLICEIGFDQAETVQGLFRAHFKNVSLRLDLDKNPRAVIGCP